MESKIRVGITDCGRFENYNRWIEQERDVEVIRLGQNGNDDDRLTQCDGVLLTGGEDVHPRFYKREEYLELCHEIDEKRDAFEWKVLEQTEKNRIPVLGICRGLQIANVFFGGTLLPHIPAFGKFDHSKIGADDRYHRVVVDPNSLLWEITGFGEGAINSAHHQSTDRIGKGLVANALSPDGVVEGLERVRDASGGFLLLVQWHPERMKELESPFSRNIKEKFLQAARARR